MTIVIKRCTTHCMTYEQRITATKKMLKSNENGIIFPIIHDYMNIHHVVQHRKAEKISSRLRKFLSLTLRKSIPSVRMLRYFPFEWY